MEEILTKWSCLTYNRTLVIQGEKILSENLRSR
jgi:hypothetical protein